MPENITVDGEAITLQNSHQGVDAILNAAGLDWRKYDLLRIDNSGQTTTYCSAETLNVRDGDAFVAARISTTTS
jgi:hypothetical protein